MTQEERIAFMQLSQRVNSLEGVIAGLNSCCDCCTWPEYRILYGATISGYYNSSESNYDYTAIINDFNFIDLLPETDCSDAKAFVFCQDGILFCSYHLQDGWTIVAIAECPVKMQ